MPARVEARPSGRRGLDARRTRDRRDRARRRRHRPPARGCRRRSNRQSTLVTASIAHDLPLRRTASCHPPRIIQGNHRMAAFLHTARVMNVEASLSASRPVNFRLKALRAYLGARRKTLYPVTRGCDCGEDTGQTAHRSLFDRIARRALGLKGANVTAPNDEHVNSPILSRMCQPAPTRPSHTPMPNTMAPPITTWTMVLRSLPPRKRKRMKAMARSSRTTTA